jgi:putative phosphoesterase
MHVVGILADTHGILDARVCDALRTAACTHILHAGEVTDALTSRLTLPALLTKLEDIAPVSAVRGNTDDKAAAGHCLPATLSWSAGKVRFIMHHGARIPWKDDKATLDALRPSNGWRPTDIVVSGHSHAPRFVRHRSGVHFLNPGSAGPQRFKLPRQFAIVRCDADGGFDVRAINLADGESVPWTPQEECGAGVVARTGSSSALPTGRARSCRKRPAPEPATGSAVHRRGDGGGGRGSGSGGGQGGDGEMGVLLGTVGGLFLKEARGAPMSPCETLELQAGVGIDGDVHGTSLSPRQVLIHASVGDGADVPAGAMRENIHLCVDGGGAAWPPVSGSVLRLGRGGAALRISFTCEPCAKGAAHAGVGLTELSSKWKVRAPRGMLATALRSGRVSAGDEVRMVTSEAYAPLEDEHPARVRHVLSKVPHGKVLTWTLLGQLAGAPTGFSMRGMPGLLKKAAANGAPAWRVVDSKWRCPRNAEGHLHVPDQCERLRAEGCSLSSDGEVIESERESLQWSPEHAELYLDPPPQ